jgi:hypothetical protein
MGLLEVKHGLLQMAESLDFLHNNARLIHRAISPEVTTYSLLLLLLFFFNQFSSYVEVMVFVSWSSILMAFLFFGKLF